jgi:diketogulonate reductase-like aldo/keto reductase
MKKLQQTLSSISTVHSKTPAQTALNWLISKQNVIAIPGTKTPKHVTDSAGAVDWRLTEGKCRELETAASGMELDKLSVIPNLLNAAIHEIIPTQH